MKKRIRAIDLFSGIGGNSCGAENSGVEIVAAFDMWKLATEVFKDNFPNSLTFPIKLEDVNIGKIKKNIGKIDLILASPECTSHSVAKGNKTPSEESKNLAYQVIRFIREFNPRWVLIENVIHMKNWEGYGNFLNELKKIYFVSEYILTASDFGVPQSRRRLYICCDREKKLPDYIIPDKKREIRIQDYINLNGKYAFSPLKTETRAKTTLKRAENAINTIGANTPFLLVYYGSDSSGGWQVLGIPLRTVTTIDRFALVKPSEDGTGHVMRMLQPLELKAAMGFPKEFIINRGTRREKIHLLGNAVCPPVINAILKKIIN